MTVRPRSERRHPIAYVRFGLRALLVVFAFSCSAPANGNRSSEETNSAAEKTLVSEFFDRAREKDRNGLLGLVSNQSRQNLTRLVEAVRPGAPKYGWEILMDVLATMREPKCLDGEMGSNETTPIDCSNLAGSFTIRTVREEGGRKIVLPDLSRLIERVQGHF